MDLESESLDKLASTERFANFVERESEIYVEKNDLIDRFISG